MAQTKRYIGNGFFGDETYEPVILGNALAMATAVLLEFAAERLVEVGIENPPDSRIWKWEPLSSARAASNCTNDTVTSRCAFVKTLGPCRYHCMYSFVIETPP